MDTLNNESFAKNSTKNSFFSVQQLFVLYSRFGDPYGAGHYLCLKNFEKWLQQANIKTVEAAVHFSKVVKGKKGISYKEFLDTLDHLSCYKQVAVEILIRKLIDCGPPLPTNPTKPANRGVYDRLTDKSRYTGVCKRKFDDLTHKRKTASVHHDSKGFGRNSHQSPKREWQ